MVGEAQTEASTQNESHAAGMIGREESYFGLETLLLGVSGGGKFTP